MPCGLNKVQVGAIVVDCIKDNLGIDIGIDGDLKNNGLDSNGMNSIQRCVVYKVNNSAGCICNLPPGAFNSLTKISDIINKVCTCLGI
jgi:hypothetical protein